MLLEREGEGEKRRKGYGGKQATRKAAFHKIHFLIHLSALDYISSPIYRLDPKLDKQTKNEVNP